MAPQALEAAEAATESELRFPPVTRDHILHCSYDYWFPKCVQINQQTTLPSARAP
jgi:hypothetical protein